MSPRPIACALVLVASVGGRAPCRPCMARVQLRILVRADRRRRVVVVSCARASWARVCGFNSDGVHARHSFERASREAFGRARGASNTVTHRCVWRGVLARERRVSRCRRLTGEFFAPPRRLVEHGASSSEYSSRGAGGDRDGYRIGYRVFNVSIDRR